MNTCTGTGELARDLDFAAYLENMYTEPVEVPRHNDFEVLATHVYLTRFVELAGNANSSSEVSSTRKCDGIWSMLEIGDI